jgi:hypothetical protein
MAEAVPPNGLWKGVAVSEASQAPVNLHLNFQGGAVTGQFDVPDVKDVSPAGTLKGTYVSGGAIVLDASSGILARLEGTITEISAGKWLLNGVVRRSDGGPTSTLTVFFAPQRVITFKSVYDGEQFGGGPGTSTGA